MNFVIATKENQKDKYVGYLSSRKDRWETAGLCIRVLKINHFKSQCESHGAVRDTKFHM